MEVHCKRCWARAIVTAEWIVGAGSSAAFSVNISSDYEKECLVRREHPETTFSEYECEYLMRSVEETLERSRQGGGQA